MNDMAVRKRSVEIAGHRTSVSVEQPFWDALKELADRDGLSVNELVARIDGARDNNLSSAIRIYVLRMFRDKANGINGHSPPS